MRFCSWQRGQVECLEALGSFARHELGIFWSRLVGCLGYSVLMMIIHKWLPIR
jgi:hypothetical protein